MREKRYNVVHSIPDYVPMPLEKRSRYINRCGFCSTRPAKRFEDALITANGSITALIFGNPYDETIEFHHELLYLPSWKEPPKPPKISSVLPEIRTLLLEGRFKEVPRVSMEEILKDPLYNQLMRYAPDGKTRWSIPNNRRHSAFTLKAYQNRAGSVNNYLRALNFMSGEASVVWCDENGDNCRRSFVSRPDKVACQLMTAPDRKSLDLTLCIVNEGNGRFQKWKAMELIKVSLVQWNNEYRFTVIGHYDPTLSDAGFACVVRVVPTGGVCHIEDGLLKIQGADSVLVMTAIDRLDKVDDLHVESIITRIEAIKPDYEVLLARHVKVHGEVMGRSGVELSEIADIYKSVEELLEEQLTSENLNGSLVEKLYHMGRYYLASDTGVLPPAYGQYNINVNLQVCSGNITDMPEMMEIFFRFFESKMDDFRINAKNIFGCSGVLGSIHPDYESGYLYHFSAPWPHYYWIACAGWVYNEFWGHYLVTGDEQFLRERVVPGLKEIALFYEDYLIDKDENGKYLFYPCFSPENGQARGYPITINAVMDIMVCAEVLENLLEACYVLGLDEAKLSKWHEMLEHLPDLLLDDQGALREWAWDAIPDDFDHRHVSHHYGVWPGNSITWEDNPELAMAVIKSNRKRGQENDSAHGIMHRLFTSIRLKDKKGTEGFLRQILEHGFINKSLMTNHNPHRAYFPDAVGGLPAAIAEMAVYSKPGVIEFLPAMPSFWAKGRIIGVCLYTFARLDFMEWNLEDGHLKARITPLKSQNIKLRIRYGLGKVLINNTPTHVQNSTVILDVESLEPINIEMHFMLR